MAPAHPTHVLVVDDDPAARARPALPESKSRHSLDADGDAGASSHTDRSDYDLDRIDSGFPLSMANIC